MSQGRCRLGVSNMIPRPWEFFFSAWSAHSHIVYLSINERPRNVTLGASKRLKPLLSGRKRARFRLVPGDSPDARLIALSAPLPTTVTNAVTPSVKRHVDANQPTTFLVQHDWKL